MEKQITRLIRVTTGGEVNERLQCKKNEDAEQLMYSRRRYILIIIRYYSSLTDFDCFVEPEELSSGKIRSSGNSSLPDNKRSIRSQQPLQSARFQDTTTIHKTEYQQQ